jgi:hypothetical protein
VDDQRLRGEGRELPGHPVVEAGAEGDEQVSLLQPGHRGHRAVHAGHAQVKGVAVRQGATGHERGHDRDLRELDESPQFLAARDRMTPPPM